MPCWKCIVHGWPDPQPERKGQKYCLFHALADRKGMSDEDFNAQVFARIDEFKAKAKTSDADDICDLSGTIFPGDISFEAYSAGISLPRISFAKATFQGKADFDVVTFSGQTNFRETMFRDEAYFSVAGFSKTVDFSKATFLDEVDFSETTFRGEANFSVAEFRNVSLFRMAIFINEASFKKTKFSNQTNFEQATFSGQAGFEAVQAEKNALRMHSLSKKSLANLYFSSMETECFSFKGCDWPDGGLWPETKEKPDYKACEELYRSLKQKAASEHDQPMVSKWHYREKLMALEQIKAKRGWKARLGLTGLYYWCSGFGEDPAQAFRVLAGLLGFALLALSGLKLWETGLGNHLPDWGKILEIPAELLGLVPFVKTEAKALASASGVLAPAKAIVTSLLHILFAAQIALFAFALRNRFRR